MSDEILLLLNKISTDIGEVKGATLGIKEAFAAHAVQDQTVQTQIFDRLGALEVAHATSVGKGIAAKSIVAGVGGAGTIVGIVGHILKLKFWH